MKNIYLYRENVTGDFNPSFKFGYTDAPAAPDGYFLANDFDSFYIAIYQHLIDVSNYRKWRKAFKYWIVETLGGGDEETGFDALANADQKKFAATHNIGTAAQRMAAIPNNTERDLSCFEFILHNEGVGLNANGAAAIRQLGAAWAKAICFSRCDHILIEIAPSTFISMPAFVYSLCSVEKIAANEITANLISIYKNDGIDGVGFGDGILGVVDLINETAGTRFELGMGLRNHPLLIAALTGVTPPNIAGYEGTALQQLEAFADDLLYIIIAGKPLYLDT